MKLLPRPWRVLASLGCSLGWVLLVVTAAASAQDLCGAATHCEQSGDLERGAELTENSALRGPAGGARASGAWPKSLLPAAPSGWSSSMSRQDVRLGWLNPDHDDDYLYRLPYGDRVSYPVIQSYGAKLSHRGAEQFTLDFGMPVGTPVHAARDGVVVLLEDSHDGGCWREECARLANFVVVLHSDGTTGEYFHLERGSLQVALGEYVRRGQMLARSGNTGYSTAPHLHFGVYRTALDGHTASLPVRFQTRTGPIGAPRGGARYLNIIEQ